MYDTEPHAKIADFLDSTPIIDLPLIKYSKIMPLAGGGGGKKKKSSFDYAQLFLTVANAVSHFLSPFHFLFRTQVSSCSCSARPNTLTARFVLLSLSLSSSKRTNNHQAKKVRETHT